MINKLAQLLIFSSSFLLLLFLIIGHTTPKDLDERAEEALEYCKGNGYSTEYCLLVDYGRHSGRVRFFLWDFDRGKPVLKSLCAHGYGKGSTARKPVFSNEPGSFCSSLGHYRIGKEKTMSKPKGRKGKKGTFAVWQGQDQQQRTSERNFDSSCQSAELFDISSYDTSQGA